MLGLGKVTPDTNGVNQKTESGKGFLVQGGYFFMNIQQREPVPSTVIKVQISIPARGCRH